jgi:hypothetical protein
MQFSEFHAVAYTFFSLFIIAVLIIFSWMKKSILECVPELAQIADILKEHHKIEERDEKIAALLKMTSEELKVELQQRDRLELIGEKAATVAARLKAIFPLNYRK